VDQVVRLHGDGFAEPFGVRLDEPYAVFQPEDFGALAGGLERFLRQIDGRDLRPGPREVYWFGADSAPDFQHLLPVPTLEFGKSRDMRLHEVLARLHLVVVFASSHRLGGMADITRPRIPVCADRRDGRVFKRRGHSHGSASGVRRQVYNYSYLRRANAGNAALVRKRRKNQSLATDEHG